jgi:uncharacterized CHY-type Zn-finger protein
VKERERVKCEDVYGVLKHEHVGHIFRVGQLIEMGLIEATELKAQGWVVVKVRRVYGSFMLERHDPKGVKPISKKTEGLKRKMAHDFHLEVRLVDSDCQDCMLFYPSMPVHRSQYGDHIVVQFKASEEEKLDPTNGTGVCNNANSARNLKVTGACIIDQAGVGLEAPTRYQVRWHNQKRLYFYRTARVDETGVVFGKWTRFVPILKLIDQKHYKMLPGEAWKRT